MIHISVLIRFFFNISSSQLILKQEGAFALAFKSKHFPDECVATRRGSPLLVGIKTKTRLATDHIPILYGKGKNTVICIDFELPQKRARQHNGSRFESMTRNVQLNN